MTTTNKTTTNGHGLIGLNGVAVVVGCSRQHANTLSKREGFPAPYADLPTGRVWRRTPVERWARQRRRRLDREAEARQRRREAGLAT